MYEYAIAWEWLSFAVRWLHVITAIAWIGSSFYFIALDLGLVKRPHLPVGAYGEEWQVHGGGFYHIQKYLVAPAKMPEHLVWFKWESYMTWLSGFAMLALVYYLGAEMYLIDPAVMERMRKEMGLDDPLLERFGKYVAATVTGDLGTSFRTREPVTKMLSNRIWPSLKLALAAMTFAILVGVTLGFLAALKPGSLIDTVSMVGAISGLSLSQFWFGLMLMYLFALKLQWLPSFGYGDGGLRNLILPAIALGALPRGAGGGARSPALSAGAGRARFLRRPDRPGDRGADRAPPGGRTLGRHARPAGGAGPGAGRDRPGAGGFPPPRHGARGRSQPCRGADGARDGAGDWRGRAHLPLLHLAARRDRRWDCHGMACGRARRQYGIYAIPPDLPLQSGGQKLPDYRGGAR